MRQARRLVEAVRRARASLAEAGNGGAAGSSASRLGARSALFDYDQSVRQHVDNLLARIDPANLGTTTDQVVAATKALAEAVQKASAMDALRDQVVRELAAGHEADRLLAAQQLMAQQWGLSGPADSVAGRVSEAADGLHQARQRLREQAGFAQAARDVEAAERALRNTAGEIMPMLADVAAVDQPLRAAAELASSMDSHLPPSTPHTQPAVRRATVRVDGLADDVRRARTALFARLTTDSTPEEIASAAWELTKARRALEETLTRTAQATLTASRVANVLRAARDAVTGAGPDLSGLTGPTSKRIEGAQKALDDFLDQVGGGPDPLTDATAKLQAVALSVDAAAGTLAAATKAAKQVASGPAPDQAAALIRDAVRRLNGTVPRMGFVASEQAVEVTRHGHKDRVRVVFTALPDGVPSRLRHPTSADRKQDRDAPSLLEISPGQANPDAVTRILDEAVRQVEHGAQGRRRRHKLAAGMTPKRFGRKSASDLARLDLLRNAAQANAATDVLVRRLAELGVLGDQSQAAAHRKYFASALPGLPHADRVVRRMHDTRAKPDPKAVRERAAKAARAFAERHPDTFAGAELTEVGGKPVLRLKVGGPESDDIMDVELFTQPRGPAVTLKRKRSGGDFQLSIRDSASDAIVDIDLAAALAELASRLTDPSADPAAARIEARIDVIREQLAKAGRAEHMALRSLLTDLKQAATGTPAEPKVDQALEEHEKYRRFRISRQGLKEFVIGPPHLSAPGVRFHLARRMASATAATVYAVMTNPAAGRKPEQTMISGLRSFARDNIQGTSDVKAAATKAAGGEDPRLYTPGKWAGTWQKPSVFGVVSYPSAKQNREKRVKGGVSGGVFSDLPVLFKDPAGYDDGWTSKSLVMLEILAGETAFSAYGPAVVDFGQDKPEGWAKKKSDFETSVSPAGRRNAAVKGLPSTLRAMAERLAARQQEGKPPTGPERTELIDDLHATRADLQLALEGMREELASRLEDMQRRRGKMWPTRQRPDPARERPDGTREDYTSSGQHPGAPPISSNVVRTGAQQSMTGAQSVALQALINAVSAGPPKELALSFAVMSALANICFGIAYGGGWSRLVVEEIADKRAVDTWDDFAGIAQAIALTEQLERMLYESEVAPGPQQPDGKRPLRDRIIAKMGPYAGEAVDQRESDRDARRPDEVVWSTQLLYKHAWGWTGRVGASAAAFPILANIYDNPALALLMLAGQTVVQAGLAGGETLLRVWTPVFRRAKEQADLERAARTMPKKLIDLAKLSREIATDIRLMSERVDSAPVEGTTRAERVAKRFRGAAQLGRDIKHFDPGVRKLLVKRPQALRPGPNRPGEVKLTPKDRIELRHLHDRLEDLHRAQRIRDRGVRPLEGLPELEIVADLLKSMDGMGLLDDDAAGVARWHAAAGYLGNRFKPDLAPLERLRTAHAPRQSSVPLLDALDQMVRAREIAIDDPLRMVEMDGGDALRFTVGDRSVRVEVEIAPLPDGVPWQLRRRSDTDPVDRLLLAPLTSASSVRLRRVLKNILKEFESDR